MILWGIVIASLYLDAQRDGDSIVSCGVLVHPWHSSKTACSLLQIDCMNETSLLPRLSAGGAAAELEEAWDEISNENLVLLSINNYSALQIPPDIQKFTKLMGLNIYNFTVAEWPEDAALTKTHHPNLWNVGLLSVDLSPAVALSGLPPSAVFSPGLMAHESPPLMRDVFLYDCNLRDGFPPELYERWPKYSSMLLRVNALDRFPELLLRMAPIRIPLDYNYIKTIPISVFKIDSFVSLELTSNPIQGLPDLIGNTSFSLEKALARLSIKGTNISQLPQWMVAKLCSSRVKIHARGSPLCSSLLDTHQQADKRK